MQLRYGWFCDSLIRESGNALAHLFFENPDVYLSFYGSRGELSGYLQEEGSSYWAERYSEFRENIELLDADIRERLVVVIIPQRAQVALIRAGRQQDGLAFDAQILAICRDLEISCFSFTEALSAQVGETHFPVDGHLTEQSNLAIGALLGEQLAALVYRKSEFQGKR